MALHRQVLWTEKEDDLLFEAVSRFTQTGLPLLAAFEQVGLQIGRSMLECKFRWEQEICAFTNVEIIFENTDNNSIGTSFL